MPNTGSGRIGEHYTAEYLEKKGYEILEMNFKSRFGEI
ncbi:MAG: YraN family protein, partial [Hominenteromicrobium sp.]